MHVRCACCAESERGQRAEGRTATDSSSSGRRGGARRTETRGGREAGGGRRAQNRREVRCCFCAYACGVVCVLVTAPPLSFAWRNGGNFLSSPNAALTKGRWTRQEAAGKRTRRKEGSKKIEQDFLERTDIALDHGLAQFSVPDTCFLLIQTRCKNCGTARANVGLAHPVQSSSGRCSTAASMQYTRSTGACPSRPFARPSCARESWLGGGELNGRQRH
jgi:hypothetical protein